MEAAGPWRLPAGSLQSSAFCPDQLSAVRAPAREASHCYFMELR